MIKNHFRLIEASYRGSEEQQGVKRESITMPLSKSTDWQNRLTQEGVHNAQLHLRTDVFHCNQPVQTSEKGERKGNINATRVTSVHFITRNAELSETGLKFAAKETAYTLPFSRQFIKDREDIYLIDVFMTLYIEMYDYLVFPLVYDKFSLYMSRLFHVPISSSSSSSIYFAI